MKGTGSVPSNGFDPKTRTARAWGPDRTRAGQPPKSEFDGTSRMLYENDSQGGSPYGGLDLLDTRATLSSQLSPATPTKARPFSQLSLVEQWGHRTVTLSHCPNARQVFVNPLTGEVGGQNWCKRNTCLFCMRVRAKQYRKAIRLAAPTQMLTLTGLHGVWRDDGPAVHDVFRNLRRTDRLELAVAWATEANPRGTGYHAHGWLWGSHLSHERLAYRANRAGLGGEVDVRPVTHSRNFAYPIKCAVHNERSLAEHLRLNGSEPLHARRFWRDAASGERFDRDEAIRRSRSRAPTRGAWGLVPLATIGCGS